MGVLGVEEVSGLYLLLSFFFSFFLFLLFLFRFRFRPASVFYISRCGRVGGSVGRSVGVLGVKERESGVDRWGGVWGWEWGWGIVGIALKG